MAKDDLVIHAKRLKGEDGYKIFSVRIKENTVARIEDISEKTGRSRNELIGILLDYALDRCVIESEYAK